LNGGLSILKSWLVGVAVTLGMVALFFTPLAFVAAYTIGLPFEGVLGLINDITAPLAINHTSTIALWGPPITAGIMSSLFYGMLAYMTSRLRR
jgi:hypothetical protein